MHVALVTLSNGPSHQRYAAFAAEELSSRHRVDVVTSRHADREVFDAEAGGYRHHQVSTPRTPKIEPQTLNVPDLLRVGVLLRRLSPDVIHYTCPHPWNMALPVLGPDARSVFTIHDVEPHPGESASWSTAIRIYNAVVIRLADRIVLHGRTHLSTVAEWGVDVDRFAVAPLGECRVPPEPEPPSASRDVLFFGRIRPYKGIDVLAEAAARVRESGRDLKLVVAGKGDLAPYREALEAVDAEVHARFIEREEVPEFFGRARFVVLPYTSATQSGVLPLAYGYRRPVVATRTGALPEMVDERETGLVVPPGDPGALSAAMAELLDRPERADEMGRKAFELFRRRYTPAAMADRFEQVYRELTSR